jgi:xanthine dehydrogenase YagR molybdenum-binding subunit
MATDTTHLVADPVFAAAADGSSAAEKTVSMPIGVPGYTLHEEQRTIPASQPPVLPVNKDLDYIGKSPERWDGRAKVTGRARYTADVQLPGMLYASFVNATVPHAKILSIDTSAAENSPGVMGVHVM